jgi:hypothetical protein
MSGPISGGFGSSCVPVRAPVTTHIITGGGAFLAAGLPIQPLPRGEPHLVYRLAPDSVTSMKLVTLSGSVTHVPLTESFFAVRFSVGDRLYELSAGHMKQINPPGLPHH